MNQILYATNKLLPDTVIDLILYPSPVQSFDSDLAVPYYSNIINSIDTFSNIYYATNNLNLRFESDDPSVSIQTLITDVFNINVYFKYENIETDPHKCFTNFFIKPVVKNTVSLSGYSIEINFTDDSLSQIQNLFNTIGAPVPQYGIMQFSIMYSDGTYQTYGCKITTAPMFTLAPPVAPTSGSNSYTSAGQTYESLFVPDLSASFIYNFFETQEEDENFYRAKNYTGKDVSDIPKYIKLNWTKCPTPPPNSGSTTTTRIDGMVFSNSTAGPAATTVIGTSTSTGVAATNSSDLRGRFFFDATGGATPPPPPTPSTPDVIVSVPPLPASIPPALVLGITDSSYIGYVILKEKLEQDTGDYIVDEIIVINNINITQLIDWKIGYGQVYRYKIKSLFRFVDKNNISIYEDSNSTLNRQQDLDVFGLRSINSYLYFFDSDFSAQQNITCVDEVRPDFPSGVKIFPNSKDKNIFITWNQKNENSDIIGFNVYKKEQNSKLFKKCNNELLNIRQNFYIDYDIDINIKYIYAIESVDVHGNYSTLSLQLIANIVNFDIDLGRNEELPSFFAYPGLELTEMPLDEKNTDFTYFKNTFRVRINPAFTERASGQRFILRILSLDTLITKEIKMQFNFTSIFHKTPAQMVVSDVPAIIGPNIVGGRDITSLQPPSENTVTGGLGNALNGNIFIRS